MGEVRVNAWANEGENVLVYEYKGRGYPFYLDDLEYGTAKRIVSYPDSYGSYSLSEAKEYYDLEHIGTFIVSL